MKLNIEFENEYNEALTAAAEATRNLHEHLAQLKQSENRVNYIADQEGDLLEAERDAIARYHEVSKKYFGRA